MGVVGVVEVGCWLSFEAWACGTVRRRVSRRACRRKRVGWKRVRRRWHRGGCDL